MTPPELRLASAAVALALLSACTPTRPPEPPSAPGTNPSPAASEGPSRATVAAYFSPPPPPPGPTWTNNGRPVRSGELTTSGGPGHCNWQTAVFMSVGWPPGTVARRATQARRFVRDPNGVAHPELRNALRTAAVLPPDARDTGYRNGDLELWLSPSESNAAYLRVRENVERWPRADRMVCS